MQEQRDALVGLAPHQHLHVVLVAAHALADDAQQLLLQARQLRRDRGQSVERHFADVGGGQRDGFAAMGARAECIEADQFAGKWKPTTCSSPSSLMLTVLNAPSRATYTDDSGSPKRNSRSPRSIGRRRRTISSRLDQFVRANTGRQAQLLQRALRASTTKARDIENH